MSRTRVKFCGVTRVADAELAVELGVDAIGLVFVARSKRAVTLQQARAIAAALPPFVALVGLFMDAPAGEVQSTLDALNIDTLQFHGAETPAYCEQFQRPYVKALAMGDGLDVNYAAARYAGARGVLLDAHRSGEQGGTGEAFEWSAVPANWASKIVLAGGLTPDNVASAIAQVRPYAVDVSSGIETAPGIKCPHRMQQFMNEVDRASRELRRR